MIKNFEFATDMIQSEPWPIARHCLTIAEIGINHNGSVSLAKKMVKEAKKCGADVAKFQNSFPDQLFKIKTKAYQVSQKFVMQTSDYAEIKKYCDKLKIEFLCTPLI